MDHDMRCLSANCRMAGPAVTVRVHTADILMVGITLSQCPKGSVLVIDGQGDKQKITAKAIKARLREIGLDPAFDDERQALEGYEALLDKQAETRAKLKKAQEDLDAKVDAKDLKLTEDEIKTLVVDDKWLATLTAALQGELARVSQTLTGLN